MQQSMTKIEGCEMIRQFVRFWLVEWRNGEENIKQEMTENAEIGE
jgi:hypothetical protein